MANRRRLKLDALVLPDTAELGGFPPEKILIGQKQAAIALGKSVRTLRRMSSGRRRRLPVVKMGGSPMYVVSDLLEFIEKSKLRANA